MIPDSSLPSKLLPLPTAVTRTESIASTIGSRTMASSEVLSSTGGAASSQSLLSATDQAKPFVVRNGRTYLSDPSVPYPLPVDLTELHRQSLRTLLLIQLFGGPICSPVLAEKPPTHVLELGCGTGFWSSMCYEHYARLGHHDISFTGLDIAPIGIGASSAGGKSRSSYASSFHGTASSADDKPASITGQQQMNWRFVQHDMRRIPWPFTNGEFDMIMIKDMSMCIHTDMYQLIIDECLRILQPGGVFELWDSDHVLRMLRPHVPDTTAVPTNEKHSEAAVNSGAYIITPSTPLSAPLNNYIVEYNAWLAKAFEARTLVHLPCTAASAMFMQEAESLVGNGSLRLAIPLSELKWEREGVGGVVSKDGKIYVESKGKAREADSTRRTLTQTQCALRRTALLTVVQMIQSLEPVLREVSGKSQDEWDGWSGKMMSELMKENGTAWGECLEIGAWWAQRR